MGGDLYRDFPVYAAPAWTQGVRAAVSETEARRAAFDDVVVDGRQKLIGTLILFYARPDPLSRQAEVAGLAGRQHRSRVGPYRIGSVAELVARPERHLVWTSRGEGRRLFPGLAPLTVISWPNGRPNHALYAVQTP